MVSFRFRPPARLWLAAFAAPLLVLPLSAGSLEPSPPPTALQESAESSPQDLAALQARFDSLSAELGQAMNQFWADYEAAQALAEEGAEIEMGPYPPERFYARFEELAEAGLPDAMFWTLGNMPYDQRSGYAAALERALVADPANAKIPDLLIYLHWSVMGDGVAELAVLDRYIASETSSFVPTARFAKARILASHESNERDQAAAIAILEELSLISRAFPGQDEVVTDLFVLQNLAIGMLAPELVGVDVDGKPIRLSDYRGKVLVLDFWGFW